MKFIDFIPGVIPNSHLNYVNAVCHAECQEGCHERKDGKERKERAGRKDRKKRKEKKEKKQIKDKRWKRNIRETAKTTPARCQAWLRKH